MPRMGHDIVIPKRKAELIESLHKRSEEKGGNPSPKERPLRRRGRWGLWGTATIVLILLVVWGISLFSYATVRIVGFGAETNLKDTFTLAKKPTADTLALKSMRLSAEEAVSVPATQKRQVSRKASGEIVVYNNHDEKPQPLVARTRFETPEGKIYRIDQDITVPGATVVQGKLVPGTITVKVYADLPGAEYNTGLSDLAVPGFKGTPRAQTIYGRSKTGFTDGFVGEELVADEAELAIAEKKLDERLRAGLMTQAQAQIPDGYVSYPEAMFVTLDAVADHLPEEASVRVSKSGTLEAILLSKSELLGVIAKKKISGYKAEPLEADGLDNVKFSIVSEKPDIATSETILFRLEGPVTLRYSLEERALQAALAGLPKNEYLQVLSSFPGIASADISFSPNWLKSFPSRAERIKIERVSIAKP